MSDLFLFDKEFDPKVEAIAAKGMFGIKDKPVPVGSWEDLAKEIQRQAQIGKLVLSFHSFPGGMLVGGNGRELGEKSVRDLFKKPPRVESISFVGCNVGGRPVQMVAFAKLFSAKKVSGYTWYVVKQTVSIKIPKGTSKETIKSTLDPFVPYSAEMLPAADLIAKVYAFKQNYTLNLVAYYGSSEGDAASTIPISAAERRKHKPWTAAVKVDIRASEADAKEKFYEKTPVVDFELVTVTL